jgi:heat shock protein HslJ
VYCFFYKLLGCGRKLQKKDFLLLLLGRFVRKEFIMIKSTILLVAGFTALLSLAACAPAGSQAEGELTGNIWVLDRLNGAALVPGTTITAEFTDDGQVGGSAGCNRYTGVYSVSGSSIEFEQSMASTMMACEVPVMEQEMAYFRALAAAASFVVLGDRLTLTDAGGKELATYKAQSQNLEGTTWQAISYNNGKQAVINVLAGTELTADFGADGSLSGSAGCNQYTGQYEINGNQITIGPLASTKMYCEGPAGVMDQESQFLAALQSAMIYRIEGNRLELRTRDGALAADFQQK